MNRVLPIILISIFLTSMFIVPTTLVGLNDNVVMQSLAAPAQMSRDARVAIYDEDNVTVPAYSNAENLTNHLDELETLLEDAGHSVTRLTTADILNHELLTIDYDVFILVNNLPRESISLLVKEFWLGGGSILSFNSPLSYLFYEGFLEYGMTDDGLITHWMYVPSDTQNVTSRHSTMKDYHFNDTVSERIANWMTTSTFVLEDMDVNYDVTGMLSIFSAPIFVTAFAVNNGNKGGKIVQLPGDGSSIPADFESIIVDSVEWLIPRPRGRVAYDLSHQPRLSVDSWDGEFSTLTDPISNFAQFRNLAVNHTFTYDKFYPTSTANFTSERLADYDILVLPWPDLNYTSSEIQVVEEWVSGGGSLLVLGDRHDFPGPNPGDLAINSLLQNFDMSLGTNNILGSISATPGSHVTVESCNSLAMGNRNHLVVLANATAIWFEGADPVVAAQEFGQGRAILSADMNIFDSSGITLGYNLRFALNVLVWLSSNDAEILLFDDYQGITCSAARALLDLGLSFQVFTNRSYLDDFIDSKTWDLIIYNAVNYLQELIILDELYAYADDGGKLIMTYWNLDDNPTHPLWSKLGVEYSSSLSGTPSMYIWDASHPIFTEPNDHGGHNYTSVVLFGDDGDAMTVRPGFTALAGISVDVQDGNAAIVVSNVKQTLFNGFLIDNFETDEDDSTYEDRIELWQNEITYILAPSGGGFQLDLTTLLIIGGAAIALIVIIALVMRHRSSGPAPTPKKKSTKKK
ncbi:MAG: hypothetical protein ACFFCT_08080 [Candidatus Odinarchaeota archaeon]